MNALISVSDKTAIVPFARALHDLGVRLLSTGGTAALLAENGLPVTEIAEVTRFPEMLDGRVKTLHPAVHAGLLARRDQSAHMAALAAQEIAPIDLLVVNLYPFEAAVARADCTLAQAIENIDIGGPAMVRSAAKNWQHVAVLTDCAQYPQLLADLRENGGRTSDRLRFAFAVAAFNRIAQYDAAIANHLSSLVFDAAPGAADRVPARTPFPGQYTAVLRKLQDLRYGENAHQQAALYSDLQPAAGTLVTAEQLQGKALSYNNLADADAAWDCVNSLAAPACVIVKHANPCGAAQADDAQAAYAKALQTDPVSAFGGVIAFNCAVDAAAARSLAGQFVEVLLAPDFTPQALELLRTKANLRLLRIALPGGGEQPASACNALDAKRIGSGLLLQSADRHQLALADLQVVTDRQPTAQQLQDLLFAWQVAKYVKSNAIVFCRNAMTMGVGAGQMSRLDSARIAAIKAQQAGLALAGTVVASDAFFPFRDALDALADAGAVCVIQPGGSLRDPEVIAAANERDLAMVFTGVRHFRH